jgi:hypothetical protein
MLQQEDVERRANDLYVRFGPTGNRPIIIRYRECRPYDEATAPGTAAKALGYPVEETLLTLAAVDLLEEWKKIDRLCQELEESVLGSKGEVNVELSFLA